MYQCRPRGVRTRERGHRQRAEPKLSRSVGPGSGVSGLTLRCGGDRDCRPPDLGRGHVRDAGAIMKIAIIPGDGIGKEVIPAALSVLRLLSTELRLGLTYDVFDWGAEKWLADGVGLPPGAIDLLTREYRAVLFGAFGDPRVPDLAHGREILLGL